MAHLVHIYMEESACFVVLNVGNEETYSNGNVAMIRMLKLMIQQHA